MLMFRTTPAAHETTDKVGLLPWGNLIEDFLDTIGISLDEFCRNFTGSYMFGYVEALRAAGVRTVIICVSNHVTTTTWRTHDPTGAAICILPAPRAYRLLRRAMRNPYGRTVESAFREDLSSRALLRPVLRVLHQLVGYLATPPILLVRALRRSGCSAILCQEYEFPRFDLCVLIGKLVGLPVFATFQGGDYRRWRIERFIRPISMRSCSGFIIGAGREMRRVREQYRIPASKLAQIFNPVDSDVWQPIERETARAQLDLPQGARVVAWHGRVSKSKKGLDVLLDAWAILCSEHPGVELRLLLLGNGEDAEWLDHQIQAPRLCGVHWNRAFLQDRALIRTYLSAADVYAFPSRHEGFAVAPIEAMACGLPVVAADISGIRDVFADGEASGGTIVPPNDPAALAAELWRLLDNGDLRHDLARRARERAAVAFSIPTVGRELQMFLSRMTLSLRGTAARVESRSAFRDGATYAPNMPVHATEHGTSIARTVFFVLEKPYPPLGGAAVRNWRNILACSRYGPVLVICTARGEAQTVCFNDRITIKYYGSGRTWPISDTLASQLGKPLRRAYLSKPLRRTYSVLARPISAGLLCQRIRRDICSFQPMLAIFEEYKCAELLPSIAGLPVRTVYDAHNIEAALQRSFGGGRLGTATGISPAGRTILRERRLARTVDQIWVCSELEKALAAEHLRPACDTRVVPNTIEPSPYANAYAENSRSAFNDVLQLIFCGTFCYPPNQQAADLLINEIFPMIARVLPEARLALVGPDPTASMISAARHDSRIMVTGFVPDPAEYLRQSQICLVPLRRGGGTRLKILEAFASGCAVISTRKGAEGLSVIEGRHLLFAETAEDFVAATGRLWRDTTLRKEIIQQAHSLVEAQYSTEAGQRSLENAIRDLACAK